MKKKTVIICLIAAAVAVIAAVALVLAYREKMTELLVKAKAYAKDTGAKARAAAEKAAAKIKPMSAEDFAEELPEEDENLPDLEVELILPEEPELA